MISVADIIQAIDGPLTVTACSTEDGELRSVFEVQRPRSAVAIKDCILSALRHVLVAEVSTDMPDGPPEALPVSLTAAPSAKRRVAWAITSL